MRNLLLWVQIAVSVLLVAAILLQQKGVGLGSAFGGSNQIYRSKRGLEKTLFMATIVLAVLFSSLAFFNLIIK
ncbi:preprotein translocase subunit SecG [Candidatus Giovannonibacteria bacterium RIFCSPLOWO2_01_FULL_44_40]|uniref:Protein-export membrane protein SecG n=1 Tax=Candidatus Giovannonibacteria bacterium RIFCSPHIGHO2_01_FULL_45_23 TaxID=1798325 RepID=A0A1F5VGJ2_9BACT|nr:MAG: preprotein translocase subunit SecG [Candidatus Giovannonibacteria bacterium RIFCSPHIGHO2_01_FULL_45_23]OGF75737.1 MAG: preprotein translocase subunit SecG [Candidatus Giovannonibacteria bacterium RIFCSPHIGHO2_02_FULL_45_13]OGF79974.1 MAG: preprotein translocase subunit SecG [Candidatus Giovannonibacteria bacterium RIFCSPLOWO2_01_FULL_44_40]